MKKKLTGIVALLIGIALVLSFTGCNKNKKPAEVVEEQEQEEEVVEEIVEKTADGKESSYDKVLKGDFSAFAGTWVDAWNQKRQLKADGTYEKESSKPSDFKRNASGSYTWRMGKTGGKGQFLGDIMLLYPSRVEIKQDEFEMGYTGVMESDKTKVRLIIANFSGQDIQVYGPYYRQSEYQVKWQSINTDSIVGENGKFITTGFLGPEDSFPDAPIAFSKDKKTWTPVDTPLLPNVYYRKHLAYGNNVFVAAGAQYGQDFPPPPSDFMVAYSKDGINWTKASCAMDSNSSVGLTFNKGTFVIEAASYTRNPEESEHSSMGWASTEYTATSKDGITWKVDKKKGQGKGGGAKVDGEEGGKKRERDSDSEGGGEKKGGGKKGGGNKDKEQE